MNKWVEQLKLEKTFFACPHGLANKRNVSCAGDIAKICLEAMKLVKKH
jgi:D-alanyl-D-alanine carboxypeptidase